ncbi:MAG: hypothetical protein GT601_17570 [Acidaminobacter sp.]|uniref:WD40 repeat domain-containing protein n=1 Tax=Acidaminobacter sp. TaxID=1872102 RepID=UPI00138580AF|nr:WD40 repeat domain-containing protein [Acidaminobacter sp.]MZQ99479.1 hypothetical protein [Acidaminobacter sp.]
MARGKVNTGGGPLKIGIAVVATFGETIKAGEVVGLTSKHPDTELSTPSGIPTNIAYACAWSPDGVYLALGSASTPYLIVFKREGDTFTKLDNPATLPGGAVYALKFNSDGTRLFVGCGSSQIKVYSRSGDVFTAIDILDALPGGNVYAIDLTPDDQYLAVGGVTYYLSLYKKTGDTYTKISNPSNPPTTTVNALSFSPDGLRLAAGMSTNGVYVYERDGDSFTRIYSNTGFSAKGLKYSSTGKYLSCAISGAPYARIYLDAGDPLFYTYFATPFDTVPSAAGYSADISEDETFFFFGLATGVNVYKRRGSSFTLQTFTGLTVDDHQSVALKAEGDYLAVTCDSSPYLEIFKGGYIRKAYKTGGYLSYEQIGVAKDGGTTGDQRTVKVTHKY